MPSERVQRRIDRLLDEVEAATDDRNWDAVLDLCDQVLRLDPDNEDAQTFLAAARRDTGVYPTSVGGDQEVNAGPGPRSTGSVQASSASGHGNASSNASPLPTAGESRSGAKLTPSAFANGRYKVQRFLGEGGKKRVYLAHDTLLDREVAFALIKTEDFDETSRSRITREAQAMGRLGTHPNIVTVFDLGVEGDEPYIVTELMAGGDVEGLLASDAVAATLREPQGGPPSRPTSQPPPSQGGGEGTPSPWEGEGLGVGRNTPPLERVIEITKAICEGLQFAHERDIVHRDLKPGNVWLTGEGTAKIGDFGLAMMTDRSRLTREAMMVGTVSYMPPEQATGGDITPRADLYSLGAMLYEMVTGRPPFLGDDEISIIGQHINTAPVAPTWHNGDCPRPLEALIMRLLAKDPSERPDSARDVLNALDAIDLTARGQTVERESNSLESLAGGVFVGRQDEMDQLKAALEDVLGGRGRLVTLVGEPGIGKTRTSEELATYAGMRGAKVLWGRCYEGGGAPPYWPWVQALRGYVRDVAPEELRSQMGSSAPVVAEIVTDVKDRLPGLQAPPPMDDPNSARFRLFDSLTSFLRTAGRAQPLVIVLDDLHWSDQGTLGFLEFLARELNQSRVLLLCTYRDMELNRRHPLSVTLGDLARERLYERVLLRGLTEADIGRFVEIAAGFSAPAELATTVRRHTEGNPLFVTEVIRDLVQSGELTEEKVSGRSTWSVRIPEGVREVIGRRLDRLSERANEVFTTAAVVGREFTLDILKALHGPSRVDVVGAGGGPPGSPTPEPPPTLGGGDKKPSPWEGEGLGVGRDPASSAPVSEGQLLDVLDEALDARLIEELPREIGLYQFTHALVQETLTSELSSARKVRLHARIAETLEELYGSSADDHASELVPHFTEAEPVLGSERLVHYSVLAGEAALRAMANHSALIHFETALSGNNDRDPSLSRGRILWGLARARAATLGILEMQGALDAAIEAFNHFVDLGQTEQATQIAADPGLPQQGVKGGVDLAERALSIVEPGTAQEGWLRARLAVALYYERADHEKVAASLATAISIAERVNDVRLEAVASAVTALAKRGTPGREGFKERFDIANHALKLIDPETDIMTTCRALVTSAYLGTALGSGRESVTHGERALEVAQRGENAWLITAATATAALPNAAVGDWEEANRVIDERGWSREAVGFLGIKCLIASRQGDDETLKILLEDFVVDQGSRQPWGLLAIIEAVRTSSLENRAGRIAELTDELAVQHESDQLPYDPVATELSASMALGLSEAHRSTERGRKAYEQLKKFANVYWITSVDRVLGLFAEAFGKIGSAIEHFEDGLVFLGEAGYRPELAITCSDYSELLQSRGGDGDRERATELQNEGLAIASDLGMRTLTERILTRRDILRA